MKRIVVIAIIASAAALVFTAACKSVPPEELKRSIEVVDMQTKWVSKFFQPWPPRLIIVPEVSFRVKNLGAKPLTYVNFSAMFNFKGDPENFGDAFKSAIRGNGVPPGETSEPIVLRSNFGVDGKTVKGIQENPNWKQAEFRLFAQSGGSTPVPIGTYDVSREIDFKEPEAPQLKKDDVKK
jgi:hypothetical protein